MAPRPSRFPMRRRVLLGVVAVILAGLSWLHFTGAAGTRGMALRDMDWNGDGKAGMDEWLQAIYAVVVDKTVEAFKALGPDYIIPEHCTGPNTIFAIQRQMPTRLVMPSTGTRVVFGA